MGGLDNPLETMPDHFVKNIFKFHSNIEVNPKFLIKDFPIFYRKILNFWSANLSSISNLCSCILS